MSQLRIYDESNGGTPLKTIVNHAEIERELGAAEIGRAHV